MQCNVACPTRPPIAHQWAHPPTKVILPTPNPFQWACALTSTAPSKPLATPILMGLTPSHPNGDPSPGPANQHGLVRYHPRYRMPCRASALTPDLAYQTVWMAMSVHRQAHRVGMREGLIGDREAVDLGMAVGAIARRNKNCGNILCKLHANMGHGNKTKIPRIYGKKN